MKFFRAPLALLFGVLALCAPALAQDVKRITLVIGFAPGGGEEDSAGGVGVGATRTRARPEPTYDQMGLLLVHHLGRFAPGNPVVAVRNMPGAASRAALDYLARSAPKDGSVLAILGAGALREKALGTNDSLDVSYLGWIGGLSRENYGCVARTESNVRTLADARVTETFFGAVDPRARSFRHAAALSALLGAKIQIVSGYVENEEIIGNLPRGELDGMCGWSVSSLQTRYADWLSEGKLRMLVQFGPDRDPLFAYAPTAVEAAPRPADANVLELLDDEGLYAWPLAGPSGLQEDRLKALRAAFIDMLRDPEALSEANALGLMIRPVSGEEVQGAFARLRNASPRTIDGLRRLSSIDAKSR